MGRPARIVLGVGFVVVLALLGVLALRSGAPWLGTSAVRAASRELHFEIGATHSYDFALGTDIRMQVGSDERTEFRQEVSGTLHLRVFDVVADRVRLGFQIEPIHYSIAGQRDRALEARLAVPFLAKFSLRGTPGSFEMPSGLSSTEAILLEEIVRTFQLTLGEPELERWEVVESHATGIYRAGYERQPDARILKQKIEYTEIAVGFAQRARPPRARLEISRGEFSLDARTWLGHARVEEALHVDSEGLETRTHMTGELELVATDGGADVALFRGRNAEAVKLASRLKLEAATAADAAESAVNGLPPEVALERLLNSWRTDDIGRAARLMGLLAALRADENLVAAIEAAVRETATTGEEAAMLIHALERHGSVGAQRALVGLMEDGEVHQANRLRALVALGGVETVTAEAADALLAMSRNRGGGTSETDLANTALLSLGSVSNGLRERDPNRADQLAEMLENSLHNAASDNETGMAIKALANTHDAERADAVGPYLDHPDDFVRAAAARTMGQLDAPGAADELSERLAGETSARVRVALADGLTHVEAPSPESVVRVAEYVRSEPQAEARQSMARYLGRHLGEDPQSDALAVSALKQLAVGDASAAVRRDASVVLKAERRGAESPR